MCQPTRFPNSPDGLSDEQLRVLAQDLRALYETRFSQEVAASLGNDEALLSRYFAFKKADRERPHKKVVKPIAPWHEVQRIRILVEHVASTYAGGPTAASSGILNHPFTLDAPH